MIVCFGFQRPVQLPIRISFIKIKCEICDTTYLRRGDHKVKAKEKSYGNTQEIYYEWQKTMFAI